MIYPQGKLMVFSKAPEPGSVMTRLARSLDDHGLDGAEVAARIHEFLVIERLTQVTKEEVAPVELWCAPDITHPFFTACEEKFPLTLKQQSAGDLGERMANALEEVLLTHAFAILIGTDCPGMNGQVIKQAFQLLRDAQASVIVPAMDGGYVLIGLSRPQPDIFTNIEWGTKRVFDETINRLHGHVNILPPLWDIDRIEDLQRLIASAEELELSEELKCYLDNINIQSITHKG